MISVSGQGEGASTTLMAEVQQLPHEIDSRDPQIKAALAAIILQGERLLLTAIKTASHGSTSAR